jgi:uncharacterized protein YebE (UPF0316 family)
MFFNIDPTILVVLIFVLRVLNNAVGTVRSLMMHYDRRVWGFLFASIESLMFAYTAGIVLTDLNNIPNLMAYVLGFAVGGYVGMFIERRFIHIYDTVNIIASPQQAREMAVCLREKEYGVTETHGEGAMGKVAMLRIVAHHRDIPEIIQMCRVIKPDAFITVEEARFIQNGFTRPHYMQRHTGS